MRTSGLFGSFIAVIVFMGCGARTGADDTGTTIGAASSAAETLGGATSGGRGSTQLAGGVGTNGGIGNTGGGSTVGGAGTSASLDPNYCNGMFQNGNCGMTNVHVNVGAINMLLVLDQSGSMQDKASASDPQSKWTTVNNALSIALQQVATEINYGLELFPYSGDRYAPGVNATSVDPNVICSVPNGDDPNAAIVVDVLPGHDNLLTVLEVAGSSVPSGGTPTAKALQQALNYFTLGNGKDLPGTNWVLLATDGGPNCNLNLTCNASTCTQNIECKCGSGCDTTLNCCAPFGSSNYGYQCLDDTATVSQIDTLAQAGIKTFVVGIPGSERNAATLNKMADAGKMPNTSGTNGESYYAISASNSLQDLEDTFSSITAQLMKNCDIELKQSPPDSTRAIVAIDCSAVPLVPDNTPDVGGASGFYIDYYQVPAHVRLTGSYCESLQTSGPHSVDVMTRCVSIN